MLQVAINLNVSFKIRNECSSLGDNSPNLHSACRFTIKRTVRSMRIQPADFLTETRHAFALLCVSISAQDA